MKIGDFLLQSAYARHSAESSDRTRTLENFQEAILMKLDLSNDYFIIPLGCVHKFLLLLCQNIKTSGLPDDEINLIDYIPDEISTFYPILGPDEQNTVTYNGTTNMLKTILSSSKYFELPLQTLKRVILKDESSLGIEYLLGRDIIFDSDREELFSICVKISKQTRNKEDEGFLHRVNYNSYSLIKHSFLCFENWVIKFNPKIYRSNDPVSKYLRTKFVNYIVSEFYDCNLFIDSLVYNSIESKRLFDWKNPKNNASFQGTNHISAINSEAEILITPQKIKVDVYYDIDNNNDDFNNKINSFICNSTQELVNMMSY